MSEFSLIYRHFQQATSPHKNTIVGIGDDCAISHVPNGYELVSCVDTLVAGRHFPLNTKAYAIGYKSVAVNLSDIASMGAKPYAILLGLSLPKHDDVWLAEFTQGIADICRQFNVELIGGDTTKSDILTISVTALGFVPKGQAIRRDGAKVGDVICVSGEIGSASFALQQIFNGATSDLQNTLDTPMPQVKMGQKLLGFANSMIDISDGLGQDLGHILTASQVGANVDLDKIPCHALLNSLPNLQKWQHMLNGGDDYQLVFTISQQNFSKFTTNFPNLIYPIGEIVAGQGLQLFENGQKVAFNLQGWNHF